MTEIPLTNRLPAILRNRNFGFVVFLLFFAIVVLRNGWVGDDAYITFRTCFNLTEGYGPVFNVDERVQTFTNPAWMFLMSFFYLFTGEAFFTSIFLGAGISVITLVLFGKKILPQENIMGIILLFALSKSFVEYSTSGLENPLNHLCLVLFSITFLREKQNSRWVLFLALIAAIGVFNRMDTLLLYAPALAWAGWQARSWRTAGALVLGFTPFIIWEIFAVIYYGFPFPNTAYAKLNVYLTQWDLIQQGAHYFYNSLVWDPITLTVIIAGIGLSLKARNKSVALALGLLLYILYLFKIGGDFMSGRFFSAPFMVAMILLALHFPKEKWAWRLWGLFFVFGVANPRSPLYVKADPDRPWEGLISEKGVADEREWYAPGASLIHYHPDISIQRIEKQLDKQMKGDSIRAVKYYDTLGFTSYDKGSTVHVLDLWALADPLMARLPMAWEPDWRIGHFTRILPDGYVETLRTGEDRFSDRNLSDFYHQLRIVTKGPIWSKDRFVELLKFNFKKYDHLINKEYYHNPGPLFTTLEELSTRQTEGSAFLSPGAKRIWKFRPIRIQMEGIVHYPRYSISLDNNDRYNFKYFLAGEKIGKGEIKPAFLEKGGLKVYALEIPAEVVESGYDELWVEGKGGDNWYSIGHLIPEDKVEIMDSLEIEIQDSAQKMH